MATLPTRARTSAGADPLGGADPAWHHYQSEGLLAKESPGTPESDGPFMRARALVDGYQFSDPRIVVAHFDRGRPLLHRPMLLELRAFGLRYLCPVIVDAVRDERTGDQSVHGFRYETLTGHLEAGAEWFLLTKDHESGDVYFRILAAWRRGQFPNWWSRLGFSLVGRSYQRAWHRRAYVRMRQLLQLPDAGIKERDQ